MKGMKMKMKKAYAAKKKPAAKPMAAMKKPKAKKRMSY